MSHPLLVVGGQEKADLISGAGLINFSRSLLFCAKAPHYDERGWGKIGEKNSTYIFFVTKSWWPAKMPLGEGLRETVCMAGHREKKGLFDYRLLSVDSSHNFFLHRILKREQIDTGKEKNGC